jgi:hypothetical protein
MRPSLEPVRSSSRGACAVADGLIACDSARKLDAVVLALRRVVVPSLALSFGACAGARPDATLHVAPPRASSPRLEAARPLQASVSAPARGDGAPAGHDEHEAHDDDGPPSVPAAPSAAPAGGLVCNPQAAFEWLERKSYIPVKAKKKEHERALRYRTETYGYVKGFGEPSWSAVHAKDEAVSVTVFGLSTTLHRKLVPALRCVEAEIQASCGAFPYKPAALSGLRDKNTYRGGEVTNHLYGIALDIDPLLNSCCGCVKKWQASALCKKKAKSIWERMSMPKCWVDAFEKYGFYWLGHDKLQDTMHFEFLADPSQIMVPASAAKTPASAAKAPADAAQASAAAAQASEAAAKASAGGASGATTAVTSASSDAKLASP